MIKEKVLEEMKKVFEEIPYGIEHTLRVLGNAEAIMEREQPEPLLQERIALIAILHDIGAVEALHKHGSIGGKQQELEGPAVAERILAGLNHPPEEIRRICYVIGHHHTPSKIDGLDFQIQWEADLIENLLASDIREDTDKLQAVIDKSFKTEGGRALAERLLCK